MLTTFSIEIYQHINYGYTVIAKKGFYNKADTDYVLTATGTATIKELEEKDQQLAAVEQLRLKKQKLQADTEIALEKIDERIQSLLAIGVK